MNNAALTGYSLRLITSDPDVYQDVTNYFFPTLEGAERMATILSGNYSRHVGTWVYSGRNRLPCTGVVVIPAEAL